MRQINQAQMDIGNHTHNTTGMA